MSNPKPISTAPHDGSKVTVFWTDVDGQENESVGQYRDLRKMRSTGGDWDDNDAGWWIYIDGTTQRKIEPHSWSDGQEGDDDE